MSQKTLNTLFARRTTAFNNLKVTFLHTIPSALSPKSYTSFNSFMTIISSSEASLMDILNSALAPNSLGSGKLSLTL